MKTNDLSYGTLVRSSASLEDASALGRPPAPPCRSSQRRAGGLCARLSFVPSAKHLPCIRSLLSSQNAAQCPLDRLDKVAMQMWSNELAKTHSKTARLSCRTPNST